MRGRNRGLRGLCFGRVVRYVFCAADLAGIWVSTSLEAIPQVEIRMLMISFQVGFSVLASLPDSNELFPLLGRPQDSLDDGEEEYALRYGHK
jgi:hypothetical protein